MANSNDLVSLVNEIANIDIKLDAAKSRNCDLKSLPSSLDGIIPLIDKGHADLIKKLNTGPVKAQQGVSDFDLTQSLKYYKNDLPGIQDKLNEVKEALKGQTVNVVEGTGKETEGYSFSFNWVVVLVPDEKMIYSFVFNLQV